MHKALALAGAAVALLTLAGCELGPKTTEQTGYRGTGMVEVNLDSAAIMAEVPVPPYALPAPGEVTAGEAYENVQVLANVSREEFDYFMAAITAWVSPEEGCNYCHNPANMASDEVYTKVVARSMIQMNQAVNTSWDAHVKDTGVTCWTCHRGNPVPEANYTLARTDLKPTTHGRKNGQNTPVAASGFSSLPYESFGAYFGSDLGEPMSVRVSSLGMHPTAANKTTVMETEQTYGLMMHFSQSLGVNCTHCHNSQNFADWSISGPARVTAWHGVQMVRNINDGYISPLTSIFPANRLGPQGDPYKVNCTTCHQGQAKPLGGARMVGDYPALLLRPLDLTASDEADEEEAVARGQEIARAN